MVLDKLGYLYIRNYTLHEPHRKKKYRACACYDINIAMEAYPIQHLRAREFPPLLHEIPDPPERLNYRGALPDPDMKLLAVVGSRNYSTYGKQVVEHLLSELAGTNIGIISGLALGMDSLAHRAALDAGLYTLAIPGGGIDDSVIYPRRHRGLAREILHTGGGLLSEFEPTFKATHWSFPRRNRIVTGIAHATLIIEAAEKSGTLISARLASDYNRELMVVPGNIFSKNTAGCHQFLKLGAIPVTSADDICETLGVTRTSMDAAHQKTPAISDGAQQVLELLNEPRDRDELIRMLSMSTAAAGTLLMQLEIDGHITDQGGTLYKR